MRYDAKRDFNAAIRSIRRLKTDVNLCNDARQDEFGNDADIINALLLLIVDRAGDDDLTAFRLYNYIKSLPSRLRMELDIDERQVFGHVLEKNEEEEQ